MSSRCYDDAATGPLVITELRCPRSLLGFPERLMPSPVRIARSGRTQPGARLAGLGAYRPSMIVDNSEAASRAEVSAEWIAQRVGVLERRYAGSRETVVSMATAAAKGALADCGLSPDDVDVVLLATCSVPSPMPNGASQVAAALGCSSSAAFDVNAACSGFSHSLALADSLVRSGTARHVLAVASERMSDWVASSDRNTGPIFADGAAAALVLPSERPEIFPVAWGSDGSLAHLITIDPVTRQMTMQGRKVFRWTTSALMPVIHSACDRAGITLAQLRAFVPHQANLRIIELLSAAIGAKDLIVADDVVHAGNTCAASVPLALYELVQRGDIRSGDPILLFGFGAGLTYAAQVVLCP
uniref:3-oxoacyl-ACP synthase n=1 Tax=Streptomyces sp. WT6 TaxID=1486372 RepID=A0A023PZS1_9ACTN|nr:hypothetical protein wt6.20c [Streptomyces sp. WT6]